MMHRLSSIIYNLCNITHCEITCAGEYGVHVKFNDQHVPESPATLYIAPESGDAKKITLVGLRDRGLEVTLTNLLTYLLTYK